MSRFIFDLDGTVLCSKHRQATLPDGTLDLAHWIENNRPHLIAKDSVLPCADTMREVWKRPANRVIICTARFVSRHDLNLLNRHNLNFHDMLSRPEGCTMRDADLKEIQLRLYAQRNSLTWARFCKSALMYDDSPTVLERMEAIGIQCINAVDWNDLLKRKKAA